MSDIAIRVENLGKRYQIGVRQPRYHTLRESLTELVAAPFQRLWGNGAVDGERAETIWALRGLSFEVKRGEVLGIIGRNGAGKTTLLKILARITEPTEGYAEISGHTGSLLEVGTGFHLELTGRENIYLNGAILGMKRAEIDRKFDDIVTFAEVEKFIETPVKYYSTGMHMRLAFSVAAHLEPDILLVDEVLAVGDAAFQKKCLGKMGDVAQEGRTVLFISHQMFAIRTLCERTIWVEGGQLMRQGPTLEVVMEYEAAQLKRSYVSSSVVERDSEDANGKKFYMSRVEMRNPKNDERTNVFAYNESMALIVEHSGECASEDYSLEFKIYKDSGEFACTGVSGLLHGIYFEKQTRKVRIDIGPLTLTNGRYAISFRVVTGMQIADCWAQACSFHIVECRPFALPREIKTPVCVILHSFSPLD